MNREVMTSLAWGIGIVVLALCATFARSRGYIDSEMVDRIVMGAIGLMVAWFGNQMPKRFVPSLQLEKTSRQQVLAMPRAVHLACLPLSSETICSDIGQHE
ncbi:MAG: hypothetical protein QM795_06075 [Pseudoxanthomonas sp.]